MKGETFVSPADYITWKKEAWKQIEVPNPWSQEVKPCYTSKQDYTVGQKQTGTSTARQNTSNVPCSLKYFSWKSNTENKKHHQWMSFPVPYFTCIEFSWWNNDTLSDFLTKDTAPTPKAALVLRCYRSCMWHYSPAEVTHWTDTAAVASLVLLLFSSSCSLPSCKN